MDGVPTDYEDQYPAAAMLAEAYIRLVKGELAHHNGDKKEALWTGLLFGPLFEQIWAIACSVKMSAFDVPDEVQAFKEGADSERVKNATWLVERARGLPEYHIEDWIADETLETAELYARAFVKAFAEFSTVCGRPGEEPMVIRHHSAVLAEIISDMLNLVVQGGEPTDLRLPDSHLHKKIALQQEAARAPSAATLRNVSLGPA